MTWFSWIPARYRLVTTQMICGVLLMTVFLLGLLWRGLIPEARFQVFFALGMWAAVSLPVAWLLRWIRQRRVDAISEEVEARIEAGRRRITHIETEIAEYQALAGLAREEAAAVAQLLRQELRREGRRGVWQEIGINFGFFILGAVLTLALS